MNLTKILTVSAFACSTVLTVSASEYEYENIQLEDVINNLNCKEHLFVSDELFCWDGSKFQLVQYKKNLETSKPNYLISTAQSKNVVETSEPNNLISTLPTLEIAEQTRRT